MDRLRRSFRSLRGRKNSLPSKGLEKPQQWLPDENSVRAGTCSFPVKYLGCIEVFESRGMQVCEDALKVLRNQRKHPVKGILYVSGDGLRVVDADSKGLIVDQTIEKVSFCAPDRNHERGFAYICRDGTTRRWMCHGFGAVKETGERLSHAVGCAFGVCLEKKQKRDRDANVHKEYDQTRINNVTVTQSSSALQNSTATTTSQQHQDTGSLDRSARSGSFRPAPLTERMVDPQNVRVVEKLPVNASTASIEHARARPQANPDLFQRHGSIRMGAAVDATMVERSSPFKRNYSLRLNELTANKSRQQPASADLANLNDGIIAHSFQESPPLEEKFRRQSNVSSGGHGFRSNLPTIHDSTGSMENSASRQPPGVSWATSYDQQDEQQSDVTSSMVNNQSRYQQQYNNRVPIQQQSVDLGMLSSGGMQNNHSAPSFTRNMQGWSASQRSRAEHWLASTAQQAKSGSFSASATPQNFAGKYQTETAGFGMPLEQNGHMMSSSTSSTTFKTVPPTSQIAAVNLDGGHGGGSTPPVSASRMTPVNSLSQQQQNDLAANFDNSFDFQWEALKPRKSDDTPTAATNIQQNAPPPNYPPPPLPLLSDTTTSSTTSQQQHNPFNHESRAVDI